jgi:DhnA family fructose-bisphosphate aldolase class Ia
MSSPGVRQALTRIFPTDQAGSVIFAMDTPGLPNLSEWLELASLHNVDAVFNFEEALTTEKRQDLLKNMQIIVQISRDRPGGALLEKDIPHDLEDALQRARQINAAGISFHINLKSHVESEMLDDLARVTAACKPFDMPVMVHTYLRQVRGGVVYHYNDTPSKQHSELVADAVRQVKKLGADIFKVPFTGQYFGMVVEAADGAPVVMAGGPKIPMKEFFANSLAARDAGAQGVAVGRNVFDYPIEIGVGTLAGCDAIWHSGVHTVSEVLEQAQLAINH